jgi:aspartate kinase
MSLGQVVVQKYGGSSVATAEKILAIADRVKTYHETVPHLVVAVSAMGKTTDQLVALARQVSRNPHGRDYDLLLASGEQVAVATLALALHDKGVPAIGLTGAQCNIARTGRSTNFYSVDRTERIVENCARARSSSLRGFRV